MKIFATLAELSAQVDTKVAVSDWLTISQSQIDLFAQATGDHQWIHVDSVRAAQGPFGAPIAHGGQLRAQQGPFCVTGAGEQPAACSFEAAVS